ncbi:DNA ligase [Shewanella sp. Isolate11]|uniref:DNA ligase n=1 Tax=Shewanella sp. Isolate11 TaxID=2908530 RepID=UPI001EFE37BB|nr:DNA ligase [Shewanella sp. Isolate11]MCG9696988.1 DNA ligase [Shewanella sp. Isolate11]
MKLHFNGITALWSNFDSIHRRWPNWLKYGLIMFSLNINVIGAEEASSQTSPQLHLQHAGAIKPQFPITEYLVSEKLDGVRGHWDGEQMFTRTGNLINLPSWFTQNFPKQALDGELWIGRGEFDAISALIRTSKAPQQSWRQVKFMVFDFPDIAKPFAERYQFASEHFDEVSPYLMVIPQQAFQDQLQLDQHLDAIVASGGEGLMLHRKTAMYREGRNNDLVKLKRYQDAEAVVIAHYPGKGKFAGMLGALEVKTPTGIRFRLGTGFNNQQRRQPPAIGSVVTYKYYGLTKSGIPRFASFIRERPPL